MKNLLAELEHLEKQANECEQLSRLAIDEDKRALFRHGAQTYRARAEAVRAEIASGSG